MNRLRNVLSRLWLAALLAATAAPAIAAEATYTLDPAHTQVRFNWNHNGFSNPGADFENVTGTLVWDDADPTQSSVRVTVPVASVDTGVAELDAAFKSPKFFNMARYPEVTFRSTRVERNATDRFKVAGTLSVHGIHRPVVLDVTLNRAGPHTRA